MTLQEHQRLFLARIGDPSSVSAPDLERVFVGDGRLSAEERVNLYAEMYFVRHFDALSEDYPCLRLALGEEEFERLTMSYLRAHPPSEPSLACFGKHFAAFLDERATSVEERLHADLARLEWARAEVFIERDAKPATREVLEVLPFDVWNAHRLDLIPALRWVDVDESATALWSSLALGEAKPSGRESFAMVWRKGFDVYHAPVSNAEANALRRALAGESLVRIVDAFANEAEPTSVAAGTLFSWFTEELVTGVSPIVEPA